MSRLYEIYLSINDFEILAEFNVLQNLHLCAQKSVCATNLEPFGEIGANFSLQLSSRTRFDKINKKKVIAENQCEKHKKSSLVSPLSSLHSSCEHLQELISNLISSWLIDRSYQLSDHAVYQPEPAVGPI